MRIQSLHVRDFLGVYEAELDLASLTILYGSNGAGVWARIIPPPGWTDADTQRLAAIS